MNHNPTSHTENEQKPFTQEQAQGSPRHGHFGDGPHQAPNSGPANDAKG